MISSTEQQELNEKAIRCDILVEKYNPQEQATLHRFSAGFQECITKQLKLMKKSGETRFDEDVMGKIIVDRLHHNKKNTAMNRS